MHFPDSFENLSRVEIMDLLIEYDCCIQAANDGDYYKDGWYPVCIAEFYDNEYQEILNEKDEYDDSN
jgi:hypothetical protein